MADQAQTVQVPKRFPLVIRPENRSDEPDKDARLLNGYVEKGEGGEYDLYKRPGLLEYDETSGNGYGVYNWRGDIFAVFGSALEKNGTSVGAVNAAGGVYQFSESLGATPKLQLGNGVKAYNYDTGGGLVEIVDGDFPIPFVKGWAYLDGTTYVMDDVSGIQGSDINDTTAWDPLNRIVAQIEPDIGVALSKQLVYVVCFKQWSTEVFYDAANATGSPLGRVQGAKLNWGLTSSDAVQEIDGSLIWPASNRDAGVQIILLDGLKAKIVSTPSIERLLDLADFSAGNVASWSLKVAGHKFYGLTLKAENITLVYDLREDMWAQWTDEDGNYFPIASSTFGDGQTRILQHMTNGKLYLMSPNYFNDDGEVITTDIYTPSFDGGTRRKKMIGLLKFVADQTEGSILQVRCNDDDYKANAWTNFRLVDLSKKDPILTNCGTFRKRAYHLRHQSNTAFRIQAVDMQIDLGTL